MQLINGDCLREMANLPDNSVDMVLTDPPYGTTACKWDSVIPLEPMWQQLKRITKKNGAIVMTASQPFTSALVMSNPKWFKHEWVWIKNRGSNFLNAKREPMKEHETVLVFAMKSPVYNRQMQPRTGGGASLVGKSVSCPGQGEGYGKHGSYRIDSLPELRCPSSWQRFNVVCGNEKHGHPTQKPVALMEYLIRTYTNEGETVLDFAMGSGTTGVACVNTGRDFIGIELDQGYFETAQRRIDEAAQPTS